MVRGPAAPSGGPTLYPAAFNAACAAFVCALALLGAFGTGGAVGCASAVVVLLRAAALRLAATVPRRRVGRAAGDSTLGAPMGPQDAPRSVERYRPKFVPR